MKVWFKRFSTRARVPQKSTIGPACNDLFAVKCAVLEPGAARSVETDIEFCFSEKYVVKIYPRSSMSLKFIFVGGGILDSDYRGNFRKLWNIVKFFTIYLIIELKLMQGIVPLRFYFIKKRNLQDSLKFKVLITLSQKEATRALD